MKISRELKDKLINGTRNERVYLCSKNFLLFCVYYFIDYFTYSLAPFHYDFINDVEDLSMGKITKAAWIAFRESAKSTFAKLSILWNICYRKKRYIGWDSYEKTNAEMALFDIIVELQTNQRLIADFGHLYIEQRSEEEKKIKRVSQFITNNKVMNRAFSTQESPRGWIYKSQRPDMIILDDTENFKTIISNKITEKIISHISELMAGLSSDASILSLGNYIREDGVINFIMDMTKAANGRVRFLPVIVDNKPVWGDKYVLTDEEAFDKNKDLKDRLPYVSLETKKRELNVNNKRIFEVEMMNDSASSGFLIFDRRKIDELIKFCDIPKEDKAGFLLWDEFNPKHRYALGADTSAGVGRDANASALIDFSQTPNLLVGTYANNRMAPDIFGYELKRQGELFGGCLIAPELNNTGYATITSLKAIYPIDKIYRKRQAGKLPDIADKPTDKLGWETNGATKPEMIYQLKSAIEDGRLRILDRRVLEEARKYNQADLEELSGIETTRHFDLIISCAIAYAMRNYAEVARPSNIYEPIPYIPSEFEGENLKARLTPNFGVLPQTQKEYERNEYE
ncbi:MAG: hypothetical protein QMD65_02060 [Patescibacteria group bacterium]|nr:hypothetical protein [Patescibacteria group bacterium]